jgi:DHA1 family multidrug resistance protein-like MFS transporter
MTMEPWRKNLYAIFIAQFFVMTGFNFVNPFLPLFIQQLGSYTNEEAAFWSGMATAGFGITLFLSGPLWGIVADRWGRKIMLLRAQFLSSLILLGLGLSPNIYWVVGLRATQGMFSGTMTAAQAMVAGDTPRDKMPFAMGLLMVSVFSGTSLGPLLGGVLADTFGYQATFYITGALLFLGGLVILFFTKEEFVRPPAGESVSMGSLLRLATSKQMLPLLLTLLVLQVGPQMINPVIPVFIREMDPGTRAATMSGVAFGLMGVAAAISSLAAARIGGRISLKTILVVSCLGTGLLYLPPVWAGGVAQVIFFIALTGFFKGGLMASSSALVGLSASGDQQGIAYGVAQSANALGIGLGPLLGGILAPLIGLRAVFGVAGGLFMMIGVFVYRLLTDVKLERSLS